MGRQKTYIHRSTSTWNQQRNEKNTTSMNQHHTRAHTTKDNHRPRHTLRKYQRNYGHPTRHFVMFFAGRTNRRRDRVHSELHSNVAENRIVGCASRADGYAQRPLDCLARNAPFFLGAVGVVGAPWGARDLALFEFSFLSFFLGSRRRRKGETADAADCRLRVCPCTQYWSIGVKLQWQRRRAMQASLKVHRTAAEGGGFSGGGVATVTDFTQKQNREAPIKLIDPSENSRNAPDDFRQLDGGSKVDTWSEFDPSKQDNYAEIEIILSLITLA
jgi:hypothetical protein